MIANKVATTITVKGKNSVEIKDVLVGEVWLVLRPIQYGMACGRLHERSARDRCLQNTHSFDISKFRSSQSTTPLDDFKSTGKSVRPRPLVALPLAVTLWLVKLQKDLDVASWTHQFVVGRNSCRTLDTTRWLSTRSMLCKTSINRLLAEHQEFAKYRDRLTAYIKSIEDWTAKAKTAVSIHRQIWLQAQLIQQS